MNFQLSGKWAVVGIILMALYGGYHYNKIQTAMESPKLKEQIMNWIETHYSGKRAEAIQAKMDSGDYEADELRFHKPEIVIQSMDLKGMFSDDKIIRVKIMVDFAPPPDGRTYWYFKTRYSSMFGWQVPTETFDFSYKRKWF